MALVTTKKMFKAAYKNHYAVGAFNVNNMEILQGIVDAASEQNAPLILQVSAGARKYARHEYLMKLAEAAVETSTIPIALISSVPGMLIVAPLSVLNSLFSESLPLMNGVP